MVPASVVPLCRAPIRRYSLVALPGAPFSAAFEERLEAARRKAIGEHFTAWIEGAEMSLIVEVFAGLEVAATKANRKRIASHPLRPGKVDAIVEKRLAEIERIKAEEAAERERERQMDDGAADAA